MWKNDTFNDIVEQLQHGHLGTAVKQLENYLLAHPGHPSTESFRLYASHYELLMGYWQSGYDDPERDHLYKDLLHRFYVLTAELILYECNLHSAYRTSLRRQALQFRADWSVLSVKNELEDFVSDVAMLSLEPEHVRQAKQANVYKRHQQLMSHLFNYLWTSGLWHTDDAETYLSMILSPTIDVVDQQLIVSAVTMAAINLFDMHKFKTLVKTYLQATDEHVRQRALVGWVLVADANKAGLYGEMHDIVSMLCEDEHCCQELAELQMQLVCCIDAEADTRRIQNEIMPDLLSHSNLKITRQGIEETEEDALEEILHPDAAERHVEQMEASMKKMADMQQQGSDIYFGGFSQMKRFPFFEDVSNWLVPFYPQHPGISQTWTQAKGRKFLHIITKLGAFCDSDKYSFVLAFEQVLDRLPKSMMAMIEKGEAVPTPVGGEVALEEQNQPAFIRRVYLQNLYRFFKIYSMRSEFRNPFGEKGGTDYLFFANPLLRDTPLQGHFIQIASFLVKRKMNKAALRVLKGCSEKSRDFQYYMMMGMLAQRGNKDDLVVSAFQHAIALQPDNERALSGLARGLFNVQRFAEALQVYGKLVLMNEQSLSYALGNAVCLLNLQRKEEALQLLFKQNYEHPDNLQVRRSLAWALTVNGKYEQAEKIYDLLLKEEKVLSDDYLNAGYLYWFQRRNKMAADMFRKLLVDDDSFDFEHEFLQAESELIREHGITDVEIRLMLDLLAA